MLALPRSSRPLGGRGHTSSKSVRGASQAPSRFSPHSINHTALILHQIAAYDRTLSNPFILHPKSLHRGSILRKWELTFFSPSLNDHHKPKALDRALWKTKNCFRHNFASVNPLHIQAFIRPFLVLEDRLPWPLINWVDRALVKDFW